MCNAGVQLQFTQGLDCKNAKCQGSKHKTPKMAPFSYYYSSSSRLKRTPTAAHTITLAINTIYGLKKRLCSLAIKARDSPCTQWGGGGRKIGKQKGRRQKQRGKRGLKRRRKPAGHKTQKKGKYTGEKPAGERENNGNREREEGG